jgi:hypothetical protein
VPSFHSFLSLNFPKWPPQRPVSWVTPVPIKLMIDAEHHWAWWCTPLIWASLGMVMHTSNPSTQEEVVSRSVRSRQTWSRQIEIPWLKTAINHHTYIWIYGSGVL